MVVGVVVVVGTGACFYFENFYALVALWIVGFVVVVGVVLKIMGVFDEE